MFQPTHLADNMRRKHVLEAQITKKDQGMHAAPAQPTSTRDEAPQVGEDGQVSLQATSQGRERQGGLKCLS